MGYEQSVLRRATARLEAQRKAREEAQERLRSEIYAKLPRVAAIDRELRRTITQIIAASLRDGSDPVPAIGVIRDKNLSLQAEKAALLTEHGYPADALDDKPACPKCSDTGWVGANMCACLKALCTEEQIRELSKLLDLGEQSFDSFSLDYYSPLPWPGESLSPRENMEFIFDVCSSYARKFGRFYFRNLFLTGAPGLGKTFLSACIARTVSESGFSVVYDTAGNIFAQFELKKFRRDAQDAQDVIHRLVNTPYASEFYGASFDYIEEGVRKIDYRWHLKKLRFSTNPSVVLFCYIFLAENELTNIVHIIEGVRYGLAPDDIATLLVGVGD